MAALKVVMMAVVSVALLGANSLPTVEARTHVPSILTTSDQSLENIDLNNVLVTGSTLDIEEAISKVRSVLASIDINGKGIPPIDCGGGLACCDSGFCLLKCPTLCRCTDVRENCHAACKDCVCTKSIPPQCTCMDMTPYTYAKCPS
ncbi:hypothetical protein Sjap_009086 [Stephania japonica]|uniref:Bowman-Birk serine protease inhibitors family domain-containing protein n=1 Tax=Stephania japonica TaxID=461633 RepID=A0AAP0JQV0_9MAGN